MNRSILPVGAWLLGALLSASLLLGQEGKSDKPAEKPAEKTGEKSGEKAGDKQPDKAAEKTADKSKDKSKEKLVVTQHKATIAGRELAYTATAGKLGLKNDKGDEKAHVFFVAYTVETPAAELVKRPVTFCFNGGPGSSSVWLHLGMLGPQRVKLPDDASTLRPPYALSANPYSLLDVTDLVFIDPVSTGFSRPAGNEDKKQFHGYDEDLQSVGDFIQRYTTRFERWPSPKFLLGESYGGLRAAALAGFLQDRYRLDLNGIILLSAVVNFETILFGPSNDLPYFLFFPTYAATAWYHQALPADLQQKPLAEVVKEAEAFALEEYAPALLAGDALPDAKRDAVAAKFARYSGLSVDYVKRSALRVNMSRFAKELLRAKGKTVGRFDGRYQGIDSDEAGEEAEYDPSWTAVYGPFTSTLNDYVRRDLKYEEELVYEILTGNVHPWSYRRFENRYVDASESLRKAMTSNRHLKVFVACGYHDLATPHFAMDYTMRHLGLAKELRSNVTFGYYPGGHMMYLLEPSLVKLREDLVKFYASALGK